MATIYKLKAMDDFRCIGPDCPASCCAVAWNIDVDADTLARWHAEQDESGRTWLLSALDASAPEGRTLLRHAPTPDRCVRLGDDGLCMIQTRYGHEYLPAGCRDYPRIHSGKAGAWLQSGQLSCPEIARLVLTAPPGEPLFVPSQTPTQAPAADRSALPTEMLGLSAFVDTLMGAEHHALGTKLYVIGTTLVRLGRLSEAGRLSERDFAQLERGAGQALSDAQATLKEQRLRPPPQVAGAFWAGIFQLARLTGVLEDLPTIADIPVPDGATPHEARHAALYAEVRGWRDHGQAALRERYGEALTRYTAASFRNKGFPLDPMAQNFIATFLYCALPLAVIALRLWHIAAQGRPVDDAEVVKAVYRVERGLAHNRRLYRIMDRNPDLLRLDAYLTCIAELP